MRALVTGFLVAGVLNAASDRPSTVTFNRDVLPVMQKHCQGCHRPGEAAPFSMLTYRDARPWAKAIKEAVQRGLGLAVLSTQVVRQEVEAGKLHKLHITGLPLVREMFVIWDRRRAVPIPARLFLDLLESST